MFTSSEGGTIRSLGYDVQQEEGFQWKTFKEEEADDENELCLDTSCSVDQRNEGFWMKCPKKEEPEDEDYISGYITESGEFQRLALKKEESDVEDYLYCVKCKSFFINKCQVHGPAIFIADTPVSVGVPDRARQTLPPVLDVRKSGIFNAGLGVFNTGATVPAGAHFGPYQGDLVDKEEAMNSGYSWVICRKGECEAYIDARRVTSSNWMRYVNCARNDEEQNLVAFQYRGGILYRCCRAIKAGQEFLVSYEQEYARCAGNTFDSLWKKKCSTKTYVQTS